MLELRPQTATSDTALMEREVDGLKSVFTFSLPKDFLSSLFNILGVALDFGCCQAVTIL